MERNARRLRYRAIGAACRDLGIGDLLFAHHANDQSETALIRMVHGYYGKGLAAMAAESRIPECEDMYGVSSSGTPRKTDENSSGMLVEAGGVTIRRPLLNFSKDQLIATCEEAGVKWVEDHTNKDPTLTLRNTVRHLNENNKLPRALRHNRLLEMVQRVGRRKAYQEKAADQRLAECTIKLNIPAGSAECIIPDETRYKVNKGNADEAKVNLLRKLLLLVAPTDHIQDSNLELASRDFLTKIPFQINTGGAAMIYEKWVEGGSRYLVHRNPPYSNDATTRVRLNVERQQNRTSSFSGGVELRWSDWVLWDRRYWIRAGTFGHTGFGVNIRPLAPEDIAELRNSKGEGAGVDKRLLQQRLAGAKANLRSTLPVMVQTKKDESGKPKEHIIALPTLQWSRPGWKAYTQRLIESMAANKGRLPSRFLYEIHFKHVDDSLTKGFRPLDPVSHGYEPDEDEVDTSTESGSWIPDPR